MPPCSVLLIMISSVMGDSFEVDAPMAALLARPAVLLLFHDSHGYL
jgi:hypothetical protein